eukprot:TRINITY_DN12183_c0_g2_i2.p1 TRINITY_DN12183_c0_g2~~TRINITY_DN12183_c0_g2_i2.p1  ORF type:complete len:122 (-),score=8.00 TRINITY_DN12183_c0_g2_i2:543-908(-)
MHYKQADTFLEKCAAEYTIMTKNVLIIKEKFLPSAFAPCIERCKNLADCKLLKTYLESLIKVSFARTHRSCDIMSWNCSSLATFLSNSANLHLIKTISLLTSYPPASTSPKLPFYHYLRCI